MSDAQQPPPPGPEQEMTPEQEQMLRQMEEEMRKVRVQDVVTQSAVSLLNLAARRIGKEDERDLEQARIGIEAVRALLELLEPDPQREVRNALSQLQLMYAQQTGADAGGQGEDSAAQGPGSPGPGGEGANPSQPPPSRLWTPGS